MSCFTKIVAIALMVACMAAGTARAEGDADYAKRLAAAKTYASTMDSRKVVEDMMAEMSKNPQMNVTPEDVAAMKASIDYDQMNKVMVESMAKHFTEQELVDLGKFYTSPTGISVMKKMPAYMAEVMPFVQQSVMKAVMTRLQAKQQAAAAKKPPASLPSSKPQ